MPTVFFPSLADAEVVEVEFVKPDGTVVQKRLLVDTGFTGVSAFVLSQADRDLENSRAPSSVTTGALHGAQQRGFVLFGIPGLLPRCSLLAIFSELSTLALPTDVDGMAGLSFLRQFDRWGAEKSADDGSWRFGLTMGSP